MFHKLSVMIVHSYFLFNNGVFFISYFGSRFQSSKFGFCQNSRESEKFLLYIFIVCNILYVSTKIVIVLETSSINPYRSKRLNSTICDMNCEATGGHMPYLYETNSIRSQIFVNGTIDVKNFPIFAPDENVMRYSLSKAKGFPRISN